MALPSTPPAPPPPPAPPRCAAKGAARRPPSSQTWRQTGQRPSFESHSLMHAAWNACPHTSVRASPPLSSSAGR